MRFTNKLKFIVGILAGLILGPVSVYALAVVVQNGGTGVASFGQGWINSSGGLANLSASTSPTVNYITATSTTGTSTLPNTNVSGTLQIGSEYIPNFTNYVASLFSANTGLTLNAGKLSFTGVATIGGFVDTSNLPNGLRPGILFPTKTVISGHSEFSIQGQNATTSGENGTTFTIYTGNGSTTGAGGVMQLVGGNGGSTGVGGPVALYGGHSGSVSGNGGVVSLNGGSALTGTGSGGEVDIFGGDTRNGEPGGNVQIGGGNNDVVTGGGAPGYININGPLFGAGLSTTTCIVGTVVSWSSGLFSCSVISGVGGGGAAGTFATNTSQVAGELINHPLNNTDIVTVGANSTTSAPFFFDPNAKVASFSAGASNNSTIMFGPAQNAWTMGYATTDKSFSVSSSTDVGTNNALSINKATLETSLSSLLLANATGTASNCLQSDASGNVTGTGANCGGQPTSTAASFTATDTTATSNFAGNIAMQGWNLSTSTTICPDGQSVGCEYSGGSGIQQAISDGWNSIKLKNGSYTITSPIYVPRSGFTMIGEGNSTIIRYDGHVVKVGIMTSNPGVEFTDTIFQDFQVKEDSTGGLSTCFDSSHLAIGKIKRIVCNDQAFGFMASTGQSYYMTYDTDEVVHLISHNGSNPLLAVGFYLGDPTGGDSGPINNTIINAIVNNFVNGSSTAYYFNSHSIKCISCDSEGGYIGVHLGPRASDFNGFLYLEGNTIGLTGDASAAQVGGYNIMGNISDSVPISNNIVDNGMAGLCVNARVQYAAQNYCTNVKQGFGTNNPLSVLEVSNRLSSAGTPGLSNNSPGLFGGRGTAINLDFWSGGSSVSGRSIVNDSTSDNFPILDFVLASSSILASSTELGVRFTGANSVGTGDVFVEPETATSGYAVFEGRASSTLGTANAGTMISSENSPVVLAPNRTTRLLVDNTTGFIGINTTTPGTLLSVGNVSAINFGTGTSTWNTAGGINVNSGCIAVKGVCIAAGSGAVSSVSNGDGTLSVSPTTGNVIAGLNLGHNNTWLGVQTFLNASTTNLTATYASSTNAVFGNVSLNNVTGVSGNCLHADINGKVTGTGGDCGTSSVNSVSNSDGSLTISPTTGSVVASLNPGHANSWTGRQNFTNATSTLFTATNAWIGTNLVVGNSVFSPGYNDPTGVYGLSLVSNNANINPNVGGNIQFIDPVTQFTATFVTSALTAVRNVSFPDISGTFAMATGTLEAPSFVSTSTASSVFPYASTTGMTSSGSSFLATSGGFVSVGTTTNIDPTTSAGRGKLLVQEPTDDSNSGMTVLNAEGNNSGRFWEDALGNTRLDSGPFGQGNLLINSVSGGFVGISTSTPWAKLAIGGQAGSFNKLFAVSTSTATATTTAMYISPNGNLHLLNGTGITVGFDLTPPSNGAMFSGSVGVGTSSPVYNVDIYDANNPAYVSIHGGGSGSTNGGLKLDQNSSVRGAGVYMYNPGASREWFFGNPYNNGTSAGSDNFAINRHSSITAFNINAADINASSNVNLFMLTGTGFLGISSSTPWAQFSQAAASTTVNFFPVNVLSGVINAVTYTFTMVDGWGHFITSGPAPTLTSCGTSTVSGNDRNGTISLVGTALTSCTLNFSHAYATAPDCTVSDNTTASTADADTSASQLTVGLSVGLNSGKVFYLCQGHQ